MKARIAEAARVRLAEAAENTPLTEQEVLRVLARIARGGKPGDRLRAAELIGKQLGMFRDKGPGREVTLEELVLGAGRRRLAEQAVSMEVVDPYARRQEEDA